jgi:hypothetical protein
VSSFGLSKVQASGQFSYAEDFESALNQVRPQWGRRRKLGQTECRPQVGEEIEVFPQRQKSSALRLLIRWKPFPLRTPDRTKQDCVALLAIRQRILGQRFASLIDCDSSYKGLAQIDAKLFELGASLKYRDSLNHHFGPNTVAGQNSNFKCKRHIQFGPLTIRNRREFEQKVAKIAKKWWD